MIYRRTQTTKQKQENYEQNENIKKETIKKKKNCHRSTVYHSQDMEAT